MTIAVEYRIRSLDCAYLSAVAISADTETGIVGGTAFNGRFSFVGEQREDVLLRFRTDEWFGSGDISVSSGQPTLALRSGLAASTAAVVEVGRQYVGSFGPNNESWLRLGLQADPRYRLDATPIGGVSSYGGCCWRSVFGTA
jgi:hypothetical protein